MSSQGWLVKLGKLVSRSEVGGLIEVYRHSLCATERTRSIDNCDAVNRRRHLRPLRGCHPEVAAGATVFQNPIYATPRGFLDRTPSCARPLPSAHDGKGLTARPQRHLSSRSLATSIPTKCSMPRPCACDSPGGLGNGSGCKNQRMGRGLFQPRTDRAPIRHRSTNSTPALRCTRGASRSTHDLDAALQLPSPGLEPAATPWRRVLGNDERCRAR